MKSNKVTVCFCILAALNGYSTIAFVFQEQSILWNIMYSSDPVIWGFLSCKCVFNTVAGIDADVEDDKLGLTHSMQDLYLYYWLYEGEKGIWCSGLVFFPLRVMTVSLRAVKVSWILKLVM